MRPNDNDLVVNTKRTMTIETPEHCVMVNWVYTTPSKILTVTWGLSTRCSFDRSYNVTPKELIDFLVYHHRFNDMHRLGVTEFELPSDVLMFQI